MRYSHSVILLGFALLVGCRPAPLPERFSDSVTFEYGDKPRDVLRDTPVSFNFQLPERARFEMTRVPGDPAAGIEPFYLSTTEVPAGMFYPWATGDGLAGEDYLQWASHGIRPSRITEPARMYGPPDRPALGMSRKTAELYCQWLSEQTGRSYRLPTEREWVHAMRLGGGVPEDRSALLRRAVLSENAEVTKQPPWWPHPASVASREPDALGLYDMLGNAAEWVTDTGKDSIVRGGFFMLNASELSDDWRWKEDIEVWNSSSPYPVDPARYTYWYRDYYFTGIRLACDASEAPRAADQPDQRARPAGP